MPKHGKGRLRDWKKGETGRPPGVFSTRFSETVQLCRQHSLEAVKTLVERLRDPDGRIAVVAANSILERAWGKTKEMKLEDGEKAHIDLSALTDSEMRILLALAQSGRLRSTSDAPAPSEAPVIEAASTSE